MGKISDIWVRLDLKKQEYDKGMDNASKKAQGFGSTLGKVKTAAVAAWAAIGASIIAFGQKMIQTTNAVGDKWAQFTAQAKAGWNTFVQSLSAMNWDNFIGRFREAVTAAKELQNALDAEFEVSNSIKLQKAAMAEELAALEVLARNASKPYEVRAAAAQKYLDMVRPIYEQEKALADKMLDAQQGAWLAGTGLQDTPQTREDLTKFLIDYGKMNNGLADATARLAELQKERDVTYQTMIKSGNFAALKPILEKQDAQIASLNAFLENFAAENGYSTSIAKLAQVYETLRGDADTQPLIDALIRAGQAAGAYDRETKKMQSALNASLAQLEGSIGSGEGAKGGKYDIGGKTTETLLVNSLRDLKATVAKEVAEVNKEFKELGDVEPEIDMASIDAITEAFVLKLNDSAMRMRTGLQENGGPAGFRFSLPEMDTTSLENGLAEVRYLIGEYDSILNQIQNGDIVLPAVDVSALEASLVELLQVEEDFQNRLALISEMNRMTEDAIVSSVANGLQALMDVAAAVEGADMKSALAAFIAPLGDTLKQMGAMIMAEGLAMEAFKKSFFNPYAAVAAGAALMAIGSAVSAGLQRLTANPAGGGTAASYGGSGSYGSTELTNYESTITVEVVGRLTGSDILIAGKKTQDKWNR